MEVYTEIAPLRRHLAAARGRGPVVLVPTMGALHDGHRACIDRAHAVTGATVVVSIFVNPLQFNQASDLEAYPRDNDGDLRLCAKWGVDAVFAPAGDAMYPGPQRVWVEVEDVAATLEGAHRPGHFRGVTTVVTKLFNIVQPDRAVFGQKDAQQALVVRRMVEQLNLPVELILAATVREPDGLALSSRNRRLDPDQRRRAAGIYRALRGAGERIDAGERSVERVESAVREELADRGIDAVEYAAVRRADDLSPLERIEGRVILAVAVRVGATRLIDNMVFDVTRDSVIIDTALF
jgi:pantoate--beta-alanine ligase